MAEKYNVDPRDHDSEYNDSLFAGARDAPAGRDVGRDPGAEGERFNQRIGSGDSLRAGGGRPAERHVAWWGCNGEPSGGTEPYNRPLGGYTWRAGSSPAITMAWTWLGETISLCWQRARDSRYAGWNNNGYGRVVDAHSSSFSLCGTSIRSTSAAGNTSTRGSDRRMGNTQQFRHAPAFEVRDVGFNPLNPQNYIGF